MTTLVFSSINEMSTFPFAVAASASCASCHIIIFLLLQLLPSSSITVIIIGLSLRFLHFMHNPRLNKNGLWAAVKCLLILEFLHLSPHIFVSQSADGSAPVLSFRYSPPQLLLCRLHGHTNELLRIENPCTAFILDLITYFSSAGGCLLRSLFQFILGRLAFTGFPRYLPGRLYSLNKRWYSSANIYSSRF